MILVDPQGMIYIGGDFNYVDGIPRSRIARLFPDGTLDNTFVPDQSGDLVFTMSFSPDEKIMVRRGGRFVRLNNDGSEDGSYTATVIHGVIHASLGLADGSVILGGHINAIDSVPFGKYMIKLDPMGVPDPTYMTGNGPDNRVATLALRDDGKVMAGGWFKNVYGLPCAGLVRLNNDGSLDQTFGSTPGIHHVIQTAIHAILPLPQEKLLIGGHFASYNGQVKRSLARIMGDIGIGMEEHAAGNALIVSPNPTSGPVLLHLRTEGVLRMTVFDAMGRMVQEQSTIASGLSVQMDIQDQAPGLYTIRVQSKKGSWSGRVVKE